MLASFTGNPHFIYIIDLPIPSPRPEDIYFNFFTNNK